MSHPPLNMREQDPGPKRPGEEDEVFIARGKKARTKELELSAARAKAGTVSLQDPAASTLPRFPPPISLMNVLDIQCATLKHVPGQCDQRFELLHCL